MNEVNNIQKRESNYDLLRVVCAFLIVIIHCWLPGSVMGEFYYIMSRVAIPLFVMLSGAFILNKRIILPYRDFYVHTAKKIGRPFLSFSLFYILFTWFLYTFNASAYETKPEYWSPVLKLVTGGTYYHLWFIYMLAGLYFVAPVLIRLKHEIGERSFGILAIVFVVHGGIIQLSGSTLCWTIQFVPYLGLFMLGGALKYIPPPGIFARVCVCLVALFSSTAIWLLFHNFQQEWVAEYLSPLMAVWAVSLFRLTSYFRIKNNLFIEVAAKASLFIYLAHPCIISLLLRIEKIMDINSSQSHIMLLNTLFAFMICLVFYLFISRCPFLKKCFI